MAEPTAGGEMTSPERAHSFGFQEQIAGLTFLAFALALGVVGAFAGSGGAAMFLSAGILGLLGGWLAWYGLWNYATADATGLRWRNWRGAHAVRWDEITDFYEVLPRFSAGRNTVILGGEVATEDGRKLFLPITWKDRDALRRTIAERATNATAALQPDGSRAWFPLGARPADFPATFGYDPEAIRRERGQAAGVVAAICALAGVPFALAIGTFLNVGLARHPLALLILLSITTLPLLGLGGMMLWRLARSAKARRDATRRAENGERFEVRADGFTHYAGGEGRSASWESVVGYDFASPKIVAPLLELAPVCRIRTEDNREFTFTNRISRFPLLQYLLRTRATEAVEARHANDQKEALGGVAVRWTGGEEGNGDRVFHCRTRTMRTGILLMGVFSLIAVTGIILFLTRATGDPNPDRPSRWLPNTYALFAIPGLTFSLLTFYTRRLILRKDGLATQFAGKERFIPWADITDVREENGQLHIAVARGKPLLIAPTTFAYGSEIRERLEEYRRPFLRRVAQADVPDDIRARTYPTAPAAPETPVSYQLVGRSGDH
jgi:hypothetical protein